MGDSLQNFGSLLVVITVSKSVVVSHLTTNGLNCFICSVLTSSPAAFPRLIILIASNTSSTSN